VPYDPKSTRGTDVSTHPVFLPLHLCEEESFYVNPKFNRFSRHFVVKQPLELQEKGNLSPRLPDERRIMAHGAPDYTDIAHSALR
jgi:hypothetical protein